MATANVNVLGNHSACAFRATRLNAACVPQTGANNGIVVAGLMTGTNTPEKETGTRFEPKDACGRISFVDEDPDVVKRRNLSFEFNTWDYEAVELLTNAVLILGATGGDFEAKNAAVATPGITTPEKNPIALEVWVKNAKGAGPCGTAASVPRYTHHLFPRCKLTVDDYSFDNAVHTLKVSGWSTANAAYVDNYEDWTGASVNLTSPWQFCLTNTVPTVGDATTGGGYIVVPTPGP